MTHNKHTWFLCVVCGCAFSGAHSSGLKRGVRFWFRFAGGAEGGHMAILKCR